MAGKKRARRRGRKAAAGGVASAQGTIHKHTFGGRAFGCYGKRVRSGKKTTKIPRMFCGKMEAA